MRYPTEITLSGLRTDPMIARVTLASEHQHTIVLIDDHDDFRDAFVASGKSRGFNAIALASGHEALAYLRKSARPCLVLLDLHMPEMDGLTFREEHMRYPPWPTCRL